MKASKHKILKAQWQKIIKDQNESGQSIREWCRENNIGHGKYYYWQRVIREEDFIFTQEKGKVIFIGTISKWFKKFITKHDLKYITFHGLRHTNATILINEGVNVVSVSHMLGHSNTSTTTDIYAHHLESVERKMANKFDDILDSGTHEVKLRVIK